MCNYRFMPEIVDRPVAVRAAAFIRPSSWLHHPMRVLRYDAYWADGRVDFDVSLPKMMYQGSPADFADIEENVHANCPEVGAGQWVGERGGVVEGPALPEPNPPDNVRGTPSKFGVSGYESYKKRSRTWRLGFGIVSLSLGIYLVAGPLKDGLGLLGVICVFSGLSALSGLVFKRNRLW